MSALEYATKGKGGYMRWLLIAALGAAVGYIVLLQRKLAAAERRGDMYRDIAQRLELQLAGLKAS
jgi:hypothetical protein